MALGKRTPKQPALWLATTDLPPAPGHPFYQKLNQLLEEAGFDPFVEDLCRPFYADGVGRPGIPPGVYFRMLFVGYFEGLDSQRGIAWRCADSRSLQAFLGYLPAGPTPPPSSPAQRPPAPPRGRPRGGLRLRPPPRRRQGPAPGPDGRRRCHHPGGQRRLEGHPPARHRR